MDFWKNRKVLITGASGFVGSSLTKKLVEEGADVTIITEHPINKKTLLFIENIIPKIEKHDMGSVADYEFVSSVIKKSNIEYIFHLAAQPIVEIAQNSPILTFETNIKGTWNLLEAARKNNVKKIIIASTAHVYGSNLDLPHQEVFDIHPSRPYETSKAAADLLAQSYADTYDLPVEIPRFTNIYGPGDFNFNRIVPKTIDTILHNKDVELWDVGAVRDFLYIEDAINAYLTIARSDLPSTKRHRVFNFGSGKPISIIELAKLVIEISGKNLSVKKISPPSTREKEIIKQYVSIEKAKKLLNWEPKIPIEKGIKITYEWYKKIFQR